VGFKESVYQWTGTADGQGTANHDGMKRGGFAILQID
jgi:hypothetical protein